MAKRLPFKHNSEKRFFEHWTEDRDIANFPHPSRHLITGLPNSGKSTLALSVIAQAKPNWDEIILIHARYFDPTLESKDPKDLEISGDEIKIPEYEGVEFTCALRSIPMGYSFFKRYQDDKGSKKNLLIIDDVELLEWANGKRDRKVALNKLFSYQSTHHGLSIIITCQDPTTQLSPSVRRECNIYTIFKGRDRNAIQYMAQCLGFPKNVLVHIFSLCKSNHDSVTFDFTDGSPYPLRFNVINPIELIEKNKEDAQTKEE